jgi:transposase
MNSDGYTQILIDYLIPFAKKMYGKNAILHHDNASTHRAAICTQILNKANVFSIKAPPYSPDLNPVEVFFKI